MAFSETEQTTISPHNQQPYVTRQYPSAAELDAQLDKAAAAQKAWARVPLKERIAIGYKFIDEFKALSDDICTELTAQMGRYALSCQCNLPVSY